MCIAVNTDHCIYMSLFINYELLLARLACCESVFIAFLSYCCIRVYHLDHWNVYNVQETYTIIQYSIVY